MMITGQEWLDYSQAAEKLNMAESTVRRYGKQFERFIEYREYMKKRRLSPDSVAMLGRIGEMLTKGYTVAEVREILAQERDGNATPDEVNAARELDESAKHNADIRAIHALIVRERETNAKQAEHIEQMNAALQQMTNTIDQMAEELKRIREQQGRPWYKRWFS